MRIGKKVRNGLIVLFAIIVGLMPLLIAQPKEVREDGGILRDGLGVGDFEIVVRGKSVNNTDKPTACDKCQDFRYDSLPVHSHNFKLNAILATITRLAFTFREYL